MGGQLASQEGTMPVQIIDQNSEPDPSTLDAIFRLRSEVFKERLAWDVASYNGREMDEFDSPDAIYGAVFNDDDGEIEGCFRFLPTTGRYMLKDTFPDLLHGRPAPNDAAILESTRFAVLPRGWRHNQKLSLIDITAQLLAAQLEYCLAHGIEKVVSVTDVRFERILRSAGLLCQRFGPPIRMGKMLVVAGWLEATEDNLRSVEAARDRIAEASMPVRPTGKPQTSHTTGLRI